MHTLNISVCVCLRVCVWVGLIVSVLSNVLSLNGSSVLSTTSKGHVSDTNALWLRRGRRQGRGWQPLAAMSSLCHCSTGGRSGCVCVCVCVGGSYKCSIFFFLFHLNDATLYAICCACLCNCLCVCVCIHLLLLDTLDMLLDAAVAVAAAVVDAGLPAQQPRLTQQNFLLPSAKSSELNVTIDSAPKRTLF